MKKHFNVLALAFALSMIFASSAFADTASVNFENYLLGTVNGQDGWSALGSAGFGCATYDHEVYDSGVTGAPASFGDQSLRISNAVTSGCFGDNTFSKSLVNSAGETSAENGTTAGGVRQNYFEFEVSFASAAPDTEQVGLFTSLSPDRGDGARMSYVSIGDSPTGFVVNFYDYSNGDFQLTPVASGLDRIASHTIRLTMQFVNGPANDIVKVYVDGVLKHTGTSWEDYFREQEGNPTRTVDSVLFRTGGTAMPTLNGKGFLFDNLSLLSGSAPLTSAQCMNGGWQSFTYPRVFKNQGQCVASVVSNSTNH